MLQSTTVKLGDETQHGLNKLQLKMEQSMSALENVQRLLNIATKNKEAQDPPLLLQQECNQMKIELVDTTQALHKKTELLDKTQIQVGELSKSLEALSIKYETDMQTWKNKYSDARKDLEGLNRDYDELSKKKSDVENTVSQLEELKQSESQRKDLLLRESAQEQKILTENVLARDSEIEALKDTISKMGSALDERMEELNHFQIVEEDNRLLQEKVIKLEEENIRCRKRLDNLNELYQHKQEHELNSAPDNSEDVLEVETEWVQTNSVDNKPLHTSKSRIPVLNGSMSRSISHVSTEQINMMKEDLLLYQEKLVEKISQNRELENAMERLNEHCALLRNSLNTTREESADRYRKMMKYMEENRKLREMLDEC